MPFYKVSGYHFQLGIFCKVYLYKYNKNSFENIRTDINIGDFQEEDSRRGGGEDSRFPFIIGRIPTRSE